MQNNSRVGGILTIISGAFGVLSSLGIIAMVFFVKYVVPSLPNVGPNSQQGLHIFTFIYGVLGVILLIAGILAIVGGVSALKKRSWGLALTGAICGIFAFFPTGIVAIVFTALAQKEFSLPEVHSNSTNTTLPPS